MARYILNFIEDKLDETATNVTYEFVAEDANEVGYHISQFLRSVGDTCFDEIEVKRIEKFHLDGVELNQVYSLDSSEKID